MYEQGEHIETEQVNLWRIITLTILLPLALQNFYFFLQHQILKVVDTL